jgi:pimeloyl-ACP methyl ester carboxylesterase
MIHGWGTKSYNGNLDSEKVREDFAWSSKIELVNLLKEKYNVHFFNLPGFCSVPEPQKNFFDVEDFTDYFAIWLKEQNIKPFAIIGYSFGGAVTLDYKVRYKTTSHIILISPALKRKENLKSHIASFGKYLIPSRYLNHLKHIYQSIFSKYYQMGTPFLRASYDKIVRRDMRPLLKSVNKREILLIYGDSDESTPSKLVTKTISELGLMSKIIKRGGHEIGATHPKEVFSAITRFLSTSN